MWMYGPRLLIIAATLVGSYALARLLGRRFSLSQDRQLLIAFVCFILALLIEGAISGLVGQGVGAPRSD
jgi:hypothetical protein